MSSANRISSDYMFFRFPLNYLLVLIPIVVSVVGNIFFRFSNNINPATYSPSDQVYSNLDQFLFSIKLTIAVLLAFSICYRWSSMQYDGSYGYWLTQGLGRKQFYVLTVLKFFGVTLISELIGFGIIIYLNGFFFPTSELILMVLLIYAQLFLIIAIAIFLGVIFKTSEVASLSFLSIVGINAAFNTDKGSYYSLIFEPDAHYLSQGYLSLILSSGMALLILIIGLRIHTKLDLRV